MVQKQGNLSYHFLIINPSIVNNCLVLMWFL